MFPLRSRLAANRLQGRHERDPFCHRRLAGSRRHRPCRLRHPRALVAAGQDDVNALTTLIKDDQVNMDDGQRIRRIQAIDADMKDQWAFAQSFTGQTDLLCQQRTRELGDVGMVEGFYGVP